MISIELMQENGPPFALVFHGLEVSDIAMIADGCSGAAFIRHALIRRKLDPATFYTSLFSLRELPSGISNNGKTRVFYS